MHNYSTPKYKFLPWFGCNMADQEADEQAHKRIRLEDDDIVYIDLGDDDGEPFPVQSRPPRRIRRTKDTNDVNKEFHGGSSSSKVIPSTSGTPPSTKPKIGYGTGDGKKVSQIQKLQAAARMETNNKTSQKDILLRKGKKIKGCTWVDRNLPSNLDELFVHKKKVEEVTSWMKATMSSNRAVRSVLIIIIVYFTHFSELYFCSAFSRSLIILYRVKYAL